VVSKACFSPLQTLEYLEQLLSELANVDANKALLQKLRGLLPRLEVVQALLRAGVPVSYSELQERETRGQLRDRLVQDERFELAHTLCTKCGVRKVSRLPRRGGQDRDICLGEGHNCSETMSNPCLLNLGKRVVLSRAVFGVCCELLICCWCSGFGVAKGGKLDSTQQSWVARLMVE
jgi:hypothetical protein